MPGLFQVGADIWIVIYNNRSCFTGSESSGFIRVTGVSMKSSSLVCCPLYMKLKDAQRYTDSRDFKNNNFSRCIQNSGTPKNQWVHPQWTILDIPHAFVAGPSRASLP